MSLKRKFLLRNWVVLAGLLLVGGASLWSLLALRSQVGVSLHAYEDMHGVEAVKRRLFNAQRVLSQAQPDLAPVTAALNKSIPDIQRFIASEKKNYSVSYAEEGLARLNEAKAAVDAGDHDPAMNAMNKAQDALTSAIGACHFFIQQKDQYAGYFLRNSLIVLALLLVLTLIVATVVSMRQYHEVMLPIERLRAGARRLAAAQFSGTIEEKGDKEFVELAADFNRMAAELESFYKKLEEKVVAKSKELVRSERLASVGFLAAGVAHEINNPLNIISGYAELSIKRLTARPDESAVKDTAQALQIIRDESFRCKDITAKLLSLAKGGSENREALALDSVAREVALMTRGLQDYRDRQIELKFDGALKVLANATEMKQVLLNLTVNALQAVKPGNGKIWIEGRRKNGWVELSVRDNGYGIAPDSLKHVFEPFYTRKPGTRAPGTGLGLSITHAIVENHGGRIRAESEGLGQGSQFTLELPAVVQEVKR